MYHEMKLLSSTTVFNIGNKW